MSPTAEVTIHPIVIVGAGARGRTVRSTLRATGVTDVALLDKAAGPGVTHEGEVVRSVFDDDTDTWVLHTDRGQVLRAAVVIAAHCPPWHPWLPNLFGHEDFRGDSFHAATWDPDFHATGKHIAVVGADSSAGHHLAPLIESARSVTVFPHASRRVVAEIPRWTARAKRWLRRHGRAAQPRPQLGSAIEAITETGVRTCDGVEHPADAIIYGTGFAVREHSLDQRVVGAGGTLLGQAWVDGMEPFCGVAVHGFPNYFFVTGPDIGAQSRYIAQCVALMERSRSWRIEVRRSSQQVFNERAQLTATPAPPVASAFDLSCSAPDYEDTFGGVATLEIGGMRHRVRVRLVGHLDPLDGNYHWQGTLYDAPTEESLKLARSATLSVGQRSAPARIVEKTPWGTHSVAGVGAPPYFRSGR